MDHAATGCADSKRRGKIGFVAMSRFVIASRELTTSVKQAFANRPHLVDHAPGFVRMDVISPHDTPEEIWLLTYWTDETSYRTWHRGHSYRDSHQGIPKGLKLVPGTTAIRMFEHVCA